MSRGKSKKQTKWTNRRILDHGEITKHFYKRWCERFSDISFEELEKYIRESKGTDLERIKYNYYRLYNHCMVIVRHNKKCQLVTYIGDLDKHPELLHRIIFDEMKTKEYYL